MKTKKLSIILAAAISTSFPSFAQQTSNKEEAEKMVFSYCYALQASALCDGLQVRLDTEDKVEKIVGGKFRDPNATHNNICMEAIIKANADEGKGVCKIAWEKYGCYGNEIPKLIQQSAFTVENAATCPF